ncbi:MAG: hypothetical protein HKN04_02425 [Rhodothermaceae bacterium]|nr:hypothetical protein [Rhodothermaceae bacterium]
METTPSPDPIPDPDLDPMGSADTAYAKADPVKRFIAALIDGIIGGVIYFVLALFSRGLGWLAYAAFILIRDGLNLDFADGRSPGKKIMKLGIVRLDGGQMDLQASIMRNWPLAIGTILSGLLFLFGGWRLALSMSWLTSLASLLGLVEGILVLVDKDGRRIGDKVGNTQIIETDE